MYHNGRSVKRNAQAHNTLAVMQGSLQDLECTADGHENEYPADYRAKPLRAYLVET